MKFFKKHASFSSIPLYKGDKHRARKNGFTLVEILIALGLFSIITVALSSFLSRSLWSYRIKKQDSELQEKAAHVMREFEQMTRAGNKVILAEANELKFYRFFDLESASPTQVRYFKEGNEFKIGVTEPLGTEPNITYPQSAERIDLIVGDVTNLDSIFMYYDGTGTELESPIDTTKIRMIELEITLDQNPNIPPEAVTEITRVTLRNMKDNL